MTDIADGRRRGRRRGELTVATIAQLAGVSKPTVSKVLNGRAGVALETRQRVEALLREHGYRRPEAIAPAAILEVVFYGLERHMAIEIMRGVEPVARRHELAVAFTEVVEHAPGRTWAEQLLARHPVGVIAVCSAFTPEQHALLAASAIPLVALDPSGEPLHATPSVGATNWSGGITAARHLLDLGHRKIAVIGGPPESLSARARLEGCRAAMDAAGTRLDDRLVRTVEFSFEHGLDAGVELLSLPDRPTAVLCGNDLQALGVYAAAWRLGLRIPQDLSVVGFDDIDNTRWCSPPMTSVRQPLAEMGATAARMLLTLAAGNSPTHNRIELATTLVVRGSTAPPAQA
ncbi:LacI family DNA-binding transcriptional regulator [Saccharothrix deserti]|uniref:LacI family DNA-binding transcriptional regulator n=1 Tax=Saccharothrix deserti TaxID=2593674 RepID=UPI001EE482B9|nr:LacI family DNA-binding transcriptional regulator [Saccharothrix deserti]